ncbi:hypothetical protein [Nocardioides sp.]|uniref:hypothetical protein n=1 Tax=Nocardioides sp. TaxID=35761 RepID=UPI0025E6759A|nr:hypothetical protein [Nocardioides sp.]
MPAGPRLARRTALALGAGVIVLTGCDDGDTPSGAGAAPSVEPDPDVALVGAVVEELTRVRATASSAGAADLVALHDAHLAALDGATDLSSASPPTSPSTSPSTSPATPGRARDLWRHERALQARLVEAAVEARSGALAALLASMSAAQSQALAQAVSR